MCYNRKMVKKKQNSPRFYYWKHMMVMICLAGGVILSTLISLIQTKYIMQTITKTNLIYTGSLNYIEHNNRLSG